jgi:xylulokinase
MTFLGIDLGTSALKAVLVDDAQRILADATIPLRTSVPHPGWSEQNPEDWWRALEAATTSLRGASPEAWRDVRAIGLSGQMHGAVLLDRGGAPIRPTILWNDGRAAAECDELQAAVPNLSEIAGIVAMPGFTAPKLLWLKRHEPENFARVATVVLPKDYLRFRLTGEIATDVSDAAGTLWLDQAKRGWSDVVLAATGLDRSKLPRLVEGSARDGALFPTLAEAFGLDASTIVAGGAGDVAASGIGIGAVEDGDAFISVGTSTQFFVTDDRYRPQPGTLLHAFAHALPERWFRMAAMLNGASCLDMVARVSGKDVAAQLDATEATYRGPSRVLFLPYLFGERTPHNDPYARGVFVGLDHDCGAPELTQAVMEGIAFSLLEARSLLELVGVKLPSVAVVGGGARSRFWMQLLSHVLGLPITRYRDSGTGPAFGAARLARMALTGEPASQVCTKPQVFDVLTPDAALTARYGERFEKYKTLYRALKPEFRLLDHPLTAPSVSPRTI